jgi:non-ribosomal peptide synthetase component F
MTFAELDAKANRISQLFRSLGFEPGDHLAFFWRTASSS